MDRAVGIGVLRLRALSPAKASSAASKPAKMLCEFLAIVISPYSPFSAARVAQSPTPAAGIRKWLCRDVLSLPRNPARMTASPATFAGNAPARRRPVRPSARPHFSVRDRDVGALLLLRDARAARPLHGQISARPAARRRKCSALARSGARWNSCSGRSAPQPLASQIYGFYTGLFISRRSSAACWPTACSASAAPSFSAPA